MSFIKDFALKLDPKTKDIFKTLNEYKESKKNKEIEKNEDLQFIKNCGFKVNSQNFVDNNMNKEEYIEKCLKKKDK